jgi:3-(3-hydroxy-phenyl)propionate hydroxylase
MREETFDVAIVGFGPSGAVAAALLGQAGHKVFVCDQSSEVYALPRAIALDHEILRVFQKLGLMAAIEPHIEPFTDSCYYGVDGRLIRRMTMIAPPYPLGWTPSVVFSQPPVERALRAAVHALANVTVRLGVAVESLRQDDAGVELGLANGERVRARFAIGCDGASSTVRALAGIGLEDLGFDEPWLVVDVLANERGLARLPAHSVQYCEPDRPCSYVIGPKNHRRWEISLKPGESPAAAASPAGTWLLLERWIAPDEGELWRQASYRFHALVASDWRAGRVFLAGDAAHQQPPFLGQGMCQGIRDVVNLAWKLDVVLRRCASDTLLDSYGVERRSHVRELTTRLKAIGALIGERDGAKARARDERLLAEAGGEVRPTPRQDVLPRLEGGALSAADTSARGTLFPQPWLRRGAVARRMDDVLGCGWRLFTTSRQALPQTPPDLPGWRATDLGALDERDGVLAAWFERHGCAAALVRPDHYVFGTARGAAAVPALLAEAAAALHRLTNTTKETTPCNDET